MRKIIVIGILFLNFVYAFSQEVKRDFNIGCFFQPSISYRLISNDNNQFDWALNLHRPKYGYQLGASINYKLDDKFRLNSGLIFNGKGYGALITKSDLDPQSGMPSDWLKTESKFNFYYVSIPISIEYLVYHGNKVRFGFNVGFGGDILLKMSDNTTNYYTQRVETATLTVNDGQARKINISAILGLGIYYKLSEKLDFLFQPNFDVQVAPLFKDGVAKVRLWDLGMRFGLVYKLKNTSTKHAI